MQEMPEAIVPVTDRVPCSLDRIPDGPARDRLIDIRDEFHEALEMPNEWLPSKLRDRKNKRRSIRFLQKTMERKQKRVSERDTAKTEKAKRIPSYREQAKNESIQYNEDEFRVYAAHLRFCRILGLVSKEDIE